MSEEVDTCNAIDTAAFDNVLNKIHGYCMGLEPHKGIIVFSPGARERLFQICGWLVGLYHAGQKELAQQAALDLFANFERLAQAEQETDIVTSKGWLAAVPARKVMLHDDGSFNSFSFVVCYPTKDQLDADQVMTTHRAYDRITWAQADVPYKFGYNGGMVYHGPGAGSTFTVNIGNRFWGLHT